MMLFVVSMATCCAVFHETVPSLLNNLTVPGFPFDDHDSVRTLSAGLNGSRVRFNPVMGCIGVVDAIALKVVKPHDRFVP